jgi:hypothetical protein
MKKLLAAFLCLSLVTAAYAQKTKTQMNNEINTNWPDNTTGLITPALLRSTVLDIVNSYIDLNGAANFSCPVGTFMQQVTLNAFTCASSPAFLNYESGWVANLASANKFARFSQVLRQSTIDNLMGSSVGFSCPIAPTISLMDCGTSNTCTAAPVTLASVVVTTQAQVAQGTIINPVVTAGDFVAWIVGGNCTNSELNASAQIHAN